MKIVLTGVKGALASILIVLSLIIGVLNAVQGALPPTVEKLGASNFGTLQVDDGSVSEPAFGFTNDTDTGMYRIGANNVGVTVGGSKILDVGSGGLTATTITVTNLISQSLGFDATGNITATGDASLGSASIGGGYNGTGCTVTSAGVLDCAGAANIDGAATITGAVSAASASIGGGYNDTGCTFTAAGILDCAGAANIDGNTAITGTLSSGALTAASASIGGGYNDTGCTVTAAGVLDCAGAANIDGATTITGTVTAGTVYVNGYLRSSNGPVTSFDPFTALKEFTATNGIIINGRTYTETSPITITGVLTNVRLLYYQVP